MPTPKLESIGQVDEDIYDRILTDDEIEDQSEAPENEIRVEYSTQDFPVDGLVKRLERGSMLIPQFGTPDDSVQSALFQRKFVWNKKQMDRFIESLLLGYPVPGIFLVKQAPDNKLLVLDGQQRLETLSRFYAGFHNERLFKLENVGSEFKGYTYSKLPEEFKNQLDDSFLQATIVSASDSTSYEAVYQIFERLNSGGTQLTPHEVRVALFPGQLMNDLAELNDDKSWRKLFGKKSSRLRDHELILRILAMAKRGSEYRKPLKSFLNSFASEFRDDTSEIFYLYTEFKETAAFVLESLGERALRRTETSQINAAQAEAIFVALMGVRRPSFKFPDNALEKLMRDESFERATTRATADNDSVAIRLNVTRQIFGIR